MLKVWNVLLIILSFSLAIFGTLITRSDILSSVHNFAGSRVGPHFGVFLAAVLTGSLLLVVWRLPRLRSEHRIESMLSREAAFLLNNLVFVALTGGVFYMTMTPVFSSLFTGVRVTAGPELFNFALTPWFLVLMALMGVGPVISWRRASRSSLARSFTMPLAVFALTAAAVMGATFARVSAGLAAAASGFASFLGSFDFELLREAHAELHPLYAVLFFAVSAFVVATVVQEFYRGTRARMATRGERALQALARLSWRNKRRYGGYVVHVGIVLIAVGIAGSSVWLDVRRFEPIVPGQALEAGGYRMVYEAFEINGHRGLVWAHVAEENGLPPGSPDDPRAAWDLGYVQWFDGRYYPREAIDWSAGQPGGFDSAVRAAQAGVIFHNGFFYPFAGNHRSLAAVVSVERGERVLDRGLAPQQRAYSWNDQPTTEVAIVPTFLPRSLKDLKRVGEDFYIIPSFINPVTHEASFELKIQPFVNWIWIGGVVLLLGTGMAVLPDPRESARISRLAEIEERAVA
jgi:cytochrome c biogenesis factor